MMQIIEIEVPFGAKYPLLDYNLPVFKSKVLVLEEQPMSDDEIVSIWSEDDENVSVWSEDDENVSVWSEDDENVSVWSEDDRESNESVTSSDELSSLFTACSEDDCDSTDNLMMLASTVMQMSTIENIHSPENRRKCKVKDDSIHNGDHNDVWYETKLMKNNHHVSNFTLYEQFEQVKMCPLERGERKRQRRVLMNF
jgi:hypothetical protein